MASTVHPLRHWIRRGPALSASVRTGRGVSVLGCGARTITTLASPLRPIPPICHRADPRDLISAELPWWLVYCRANQEVGLSSRLLAADVPHLLLLARHDRATPSGRRRVTDRSLFPGYLFVTGEFGLANTKPSALRGLVSANPIPDVPRLITDLSQLLDAIESGAPIGKAEPPRPGMLVRVNSGPWEGKVGTLVREGHGGHVLLLHVHALGRVCPLEIESFRCEAVE